MRDLRAPSVTSKSRGRKVRDYLWRNYAAIMLMKMHFPARLPLVEGWLEGEGGRCRTRCHLKKETANFVFFANKPCQLAQSPPHSPDSSSALQSSANSRQLSVVCPQFSVLGPRSSIHSPASSVSSSLFMLSCAH